MKDRLTISEGGLLPVLVALLILGPRDAFAFHAPAAPELLSFDQRGGTIDHGTHVAGIAAAIRD